MAQATEQVDVVIVGAGLAGLSAALRLRQSQKSFVILEGDDRIGGRTLTEPDVSRYLDLGGAYIAPTQTYVNAMIEQFEIPTFETWLPDDKPSIYQPENAEALSFYDNYPITSDVKAGLGLIELLTLQARAHLERPWECPDAIQLDAITVEDWGKANLATPYARELLTIAVRSAFSVEPREISMFYLIYYGATCGSFRAFENVRGGGDSIRFAYGTGDLVANLVKMVDPDNIKLQEKVTVIDDNRTSVQVTSSGQDELLRYWNCRAVIVAMSPVVSNRISYKNGLPDRRTKLCAGSIRGRTIKGFLKYDVAWWRQKNTGYVLSATGPADWIMDNTWNDPADGQWKNPALMMFMVGDRAIQLGELTKAQREALLLEQVATLFGRTPRGVTYEGYIERNWQDDPWACGCPAACLAPTILTACGSALRQPAGQIFWAGSESATDWMGGYMNGAIQSGIRAAGQALASL